MARNRRISTLMPPLEFSHPRSLTHSGNQNAHIKKMKRVPKWILEAVCYPRSSLHSYLKSCQPPSSELVAGVALVARLTALLDQFPQQVFIEPRLLPFPTDLNIFEYSAINSQVLPTALKESVHHLASLLPTIESKAAHAVAKLIETWLGSVTSSLTCNILLQVLS